MLWQDEEKLPSPYIQTCCRRRRRRRRLSRPRRRRTKIGTSRDRHLHINLETRHFILRRRTIARGQTSLPTVAASPRRRLCRPRLRRLSALDVVEKQT